MMPVGKSIELTTEKSVIFYREVLFAKLWITARYLCRQGIQRRVSPNKTDAEVRIVLLA
jgi:hypothetical protein